MALLLSILFLASTAFGCACIGKVPACEKIGTVDGVFLGRATASIQISNPLGHTYTGYLVKLAERFKGVLSNQQEVLIDPGTGSSCSQHFKLGEDYLFYASKARRKSRGEWIQRNGWKVSLSGQPTEKGDLDLYSPNYCDTLPLARASEDLERLRRISLGESANTVYGTAFEVHGEFDKSNVRLPFSNATIFLRSKLKTLHQQSGIHGDFTFTNVEPGSYELWAERSPWKSSPLSRLELMQGGCAEKSLSLSTGSTLQGFARYRDGSPAGGIPIELWRLTDSGQLSDKYLLRTATSASGAFMFNNVSASPFVLAINLGTNVNLPYPTTFYPAGASLLEATKFHLAPRSREFGLDFVVPPQLLLRTVPPPPTPAINDNR